MQPAARVRHARPADASAIAKVHVETWRAAYAGLVPEQYLVRMTASGQAFTWRKVLARKRAEEAVFVAEAPPFGQSAPHHVVAFGSCGRQRAGDLLYAGEVYTLYVAQDWQGYGIGRQLLTAMFRWLHESGIPDCVIWVLANNPSRFFYERMGGHRVAEREQVFAGEMLTEAAYGWSDLEAWLAQMRS